MKRIGKVLKSFLKKFGHSGGVPLGDDEEESIDPLHNFISGSSIFAYATPNN